MRSTSDPPSVPGAAMVVALAIVVAAVAGVSVYYREHGRSPTESTSVSRTESAPAAAAPPANPLDRDGRLIFMLTAQGVQMSGTREATISDAHRVCARFARGETEQQIVQDILSGSPGMSSNTASTFADTAISVYCPQG